MPNPTEPGRACRDSKHERKTVARKKTSPPTACGDLRSMTNVCAPQVSDRAKKRGKTQLGTLGAGNHYVEVQAGPLLTACA